MEPLNTRSVYPPFPTTMVPPSHLHGDSSQSTFSVELAPDDGHNSLLVSVKIRLVCIGSSNQSLAQVYLLQLSVWCWLEETYIF